MKRFIVIFGLLLFVACGGIMPPPAISQVDSLVLKRNNGVDQFSAADQTNELVTIEAFNNGVKAANDTIVFQVEAPANAAGQGVTPSSGVTNANGSVKFEFTSGDIFGIYTVHCIFSSDTLLSVSFQVIEDKPFHKELALAGIRKLDTILARVPDLGLAASEQETFIDEDGKKKNKGKKTQTAAENTNIENELDKLWKTLSRLADLGDGLK